VTDVRRIVSENRRVVWIIAAALVINAAAYALVVYPLARRVKTGEQQAGAATAELVAARKTHAAARGTVAGKKEADVELQNFYRDVLPPDLSGARRMLYPHLPQLAENSNLRMIRYKWGDPEGARGSELKKLPLTLFLSGDYTNIRRFIHELETAPEFIVLESVVVTSEAEGERRLTITAQVATYYRAADNGN
jgi:Tfp pilus assembly protein PilO